MHVFTGKDVLAKYFHQDQAMLASRRSTYDASLSLTSSICLYIQKNSSFYSNKMIMSSSLSHVGKQRSSCACA